MLITPIFKLKAIPKVLKNVLQCLKIFFIIFIPPSNTLTTPLMLISTETGGCGKGSFLAPKDILFSFSFFVNRKKARANYALATAFTIYFQFPF